MAHSDASNLALFAPLLAGDSDGALALLRSDDADALTHEGPCGLTTLHAAVVGGCHPAVLAALVAAGVPVDGELQGRPDENPSAKEVLEGLGFTDRHKFYIGLVGNTALDMAFRMENYGDTVEQLLQLGADFIAMQPVPALFMPMDGGPRPEHPANSRLFCYTRSQHVSSPLQATLMKHVEARLATGVLQLNTKYKAGAVAMAAAMAGSAPLLDAGAAALEGLLAAQAAAGQAYTDDDCAMADQLLMMILGFFAGSMASIRQASMLRMLLSRRLPFRLNGDGRDGPGPLDMAAHGCAAADRVPVLVAAGADVTISNILQAARGTFPEGLQALLACARPPVDTSRAYVMIDGRPSYTCPIHGVLQGLIPRLQSCGMFRSLGVYPGWQSSAPLDYLGSVGMEQKELEKARRSLEALLAAGYRPTVYHNVPMPQFRGGQLVYSQGELVPTLDPFDHYPPGILPDWLLVVARGDPWSPETHHLWPPAFKAAARTLLLASIRKPAADGSTGAGRLTLAALPSSVLLSIMRLAALPLLAWRSSELEAQPTLNRNPAHQLMLSSHLLAALPVGDRTV